MGATFLCSFDNNDQHCFSDMSTGKDGEPSSGQPSLLKLTTFISDNFFEDIFFSDKPEPFFLRSSVLGGRVGVELENPEELKSKVNSNFKDLLWTDFLVYIS